MSYNNVVHLITSTIITLQQIRNELSLPMTLSSFGISWLLSMPKLSKRASLNPRILLKPRPLSLHHPKQRYIVRIWLHSDIPCIFLHSVHNFDFGRWSTVQQARFDLPYECVNTVRIKRQAWAIPLYCQPNRLKQMWNIIFHASGTKRIVSLWHTDVCDRS